MADSLRPARHVLLGTQEQSGGVGGVPAAQVWFAGKQERRWRSAPSASFGGAAYLGAWTSVQLVGSELRIKVGGRVRCGPRAAQGAGCKLASAGCTLQVHDRSGEGLLVDGGYLAFKGAVGGANC